MEPENSLNSQMPQQFINNDYGFNDEGQDKTKRWFVFIITMLISLLLIVAIISLVVNMIGGGRDNKARLAILYEQLGDSMTYEELMGKVNEITPEAHIAYDEGVYLIEIGDGENDHISFMEEADSTNEVDDDGDSEDLSEEEQTFADNLVDEIMAIDDSELDEDDLEGELDDEDYDEDGDDEKEAYDEADETIAEEMSREQEQSAEAELLDEDLNSEQEEDDAVNENDKSYIEPSNVSPATIMTAFVYHYDYIVNDSDSDSNDTDEVEDDLVEMTIEKMSDGYEFVKDGESVVFPTKKAAIDELLKIIP